MLSATSCDRLFSLLGAGGAFFDAIFLLNIQFLGVKRQLS